MQRSHTKKEQGNVAMVKTKDTIDWAIKKTLTYLSKKITVTEAFLFGSYAQGNYHESSDIDLAVFSPEIEKLNIEEKAELFSEVRFFSCGSAS
jgi:predicted nucleotidyltransferase